MIRDKFMNNVIAYELITDILVYVLMTSMDHIFN